jgi:spore maturation protein SpmA/spore maturation protein SpmB
LSGIFFAIVLIAFLVAAYRQVTGETVIVDDGVQTPMEALSTAVIDAASGAVTLSLGLIGVMALFLGLMKVAEHGGLLVVIAKTVRPLMVRLFPEVPADHPAMGAMILNLSANVLGLGNAATPFGIRAMQELDKINPVKGTATNAMALFLAINTSSVTLLPTGVIAIRAAAGSQDPAGILPTTLFATICSTTVAIIAARLYCNFWPAPTGPAGAATEAEAPAQDPEEGLERETAEGYPGWVSALVLAAILAIIPLTILYGSAIAPWIIPALVVGLLAYGVARRGAMDLLISPLGAITGHFGMPAEALPMALLRPLSGSGAYGIMASIIQDPAIGPDSYVGYLVSTLQGSTETTFYVLAVYFGAVQIRRIRHAMAAALTADLAGIVAAVVICTIVFG